MQVFTSAELLVDWGCTSMVSPSEASPRCTYMPTTIKENRKCRPATGKLPGVWLRKVLWSNCGHARLVPHGSLQMIGGSKIGSETICHRVITSCMTLLLHHWFEPFSKQRLYVYCQLPDLVDVCNTFTVQAWFSQSAPAGRFKFPGVAGADRVSHTVVVLLLPMTYTRKACVAPSKRLQRAAVLPHNSQAPCMQLSST